MFFYAFVKCTIENLLALHTTKYMCLLPCNEDGFSGLHVSELTYAPRLWEWVVLF